MTFWRYWPWLVAIFYLLGYEGYALLTHRPTLSRYVWTAQRRWPALVYVVTAVLVVLWMHFFGGWF